jgi:hypothetical protein
MATEKDIIIPVGIFGDTFSEQDAKIGVVYNQCVDKNGKLFVERLDPPMYTAPVIIDADGKYHLDRDNVVWHDPKPADGDALLDEKDVSEDLKWIFKDIVS